VNESILLTGAFDHKLNVVDVRKGSDSAQKYKVKADIESTCWHPTSENHFVASLENGQVMGFDIR
jgi:hypothetical protein